MVGAVINDKKSGRFRNAPHFSGMTLQEAVAHAEQNLESPYDK